MTVPEEIQVLKDVAGRLDRAGIPYMLSGSMAMHFYAAPRMTRDIDLVNPERACRRIEPHFGHGLRRPWCTTERLIAA